MLLYQLLGVHLWHDKPSLPSLRIHYHYDNFSLPLSFLVVDGDEHLMTLMQDSPHWLRYLNGTLSGIH